MDVSFDLFQRVLLLLVGTSWVRLPFSWYSQSWQLPTVRLVYLVHYALVHATSPEKNLVNLFRV